MLLVELETTLAEGEWATAFAAELDDVIVTQAEGTGDAAFATVVEVDLEATLAEGAETAAFTAQEELKIATFAAWIVSLVTVGLGASMMWVVQEIGANEGVPLTIAAYTGYYVEALMLRLGILDEVLDHFFLRGNQSY